MTGFVPDFNRTCTVRNTGIVTMTSQGQRRAGLHCISDTVELGTDM
jgi:hypothetical protein